MRKNRSKHASTKYPNLYRYPDQPHWVFRKASSEKGSEFYCSTGLEPTDRNEAAAYRIGVERFNEWLGSHGEDARMRELLRVVLESKDDPELADRTYATTLNQVEKHLIPACGHLHPSKITTEWWLNYQRTERKKPREVTFRDGSTKELAPRTSFFNTRKTLNEALNLAYQRKLIDRVPKLPLNDPEPEKPEVIPKTTILRIIRFTGHIAAYSRGDSWTKEGRFRKVALKLLVFIMWKQGARPGEILQYRWDMIDWEKGAIAIPAGITKTRRARKIPLNPKVARILRFLYPRRESPWLFPSLLKPGEPLTDYDSAWGTVMGRLGLTYDIYNLRDTFITERLKEGLSAIFIGKYCDNSAVMIERRYAVADEEILQRVAGWR